MGNSQTRLFDETLRAVDINTDIINEVLDNTPNESAHSNTSKNATIDEGQTTETKSGSVSRASPKPFIVRRVKHIQQLFSYDGVNLGGGSSCSVMKMQERRTGNTYAVKKLKMSVPFHARLFQREVEMLTTLQHPHIVRYHSHFADRKRFYVVTEYCKGIAPQYILYCISNLFAVHCRIERIPHEIMCIEADTVLG